MCSFIENIFTILSEPRCFSMRRLWIKQRSSLVNPTTVTKLQLVRTKTEPVYIGRRKTTSFIERIIYLQERKLKYQTGVTFWLTPDNVFQCRNCHSYHAPSRKSASSVSLTILTFTSVCLFLRENDGLVCATMTSLICWHFGTNYIRPVLLLVLLFLLPRAGC